MPELPEVETIMNGLRPFMENAVFEEVELKRADLRFPFPDGFAERLRGSRVCKMYRRAKYICISLDSGLELMMHLGMSGRFSVDLEDASPLKSMGRGDAGGSLRPVNPAHDHVIFRMGNQARILYNDPRRFGYMYLVEADEVRTHPAFASLGLEPLSPDLNEKSLARLVRGRKTNLKTFLLDQRFIAGLGNIYVCEALYRAKLSPFRVAGTLAEPDMKKARFSLIKEIKSTLKEAIAAGGSSLRDYRHADGATGYFQHCFKVYDQEGKACPTVKCPSDIKKEVIGGRSTFFCPVCQK